VHARGDNFNWLQADVEKERSFRCKEVRLKRSIYPSIGVFHSVCYFSGRDMHVE
jgi:hypothetical protein